MVTVFVPEEVKAGESRNQEPEKEQRTTSGGVLKQITSIEKIPEDAEGENQQPKAKKKKTVKFNIDNVDEPKPEENTEPKSPAEKPPHKKVASQKVVPAQAAAKVEVKEPLQIAALGAELKRERKSP